MMYKIPEDKHYQLHYRTHASINIYIYIYLHLAPIILTTQTPLLSSTREPTFARNMDGKFVLIEI